MRTCSLLIMQGYHDGIHFSSPSLLRASGLFTCEFLPQPWSLAQSSEQGHLQGENEEEEEEEGEDV